MTRGNAGENRGDRNGRSLVDVNFVTVLHNRPAARGNEKEGKGEPVNVSTVGESSAHKAVSDEENIEHNDQKDFTYSDP